MLFSVLVMAAAVQAAPVTITQPLADWRSVQVAQGYWVWRSFPGGSEALFQSVGGVQLALRCNLSNRTVTMVRSGAVPGSSLIVRTSNMERSLPASGTLAATDRLLDAVAFSRGRFSVEGGGVARLVVPAWPEAARSVEDCRK
jgi:hypothetical protein